MDVGNLISDSSAFSKSRCSNWKFSVYILLKPGLENFEHYFSSMWNQCSCAIVWIVFGIAFLWDWNENWLFPIIWPLVSFPHLLPFEGRFEPATIYLPKVENTAFTIRAQFPGSQKNVSLYLESFVKTHLRNTVPYHEKSMCSVSAPCSVSAECHTCFYPD